MASLMYLIPKVVPADCKFNLVFMASYK
ncbi:hypothetical protein CCACVL1_02238, partial [Corchorus capsularis]